MERSTNPVRTNPIREELRHEAYRLLATAMQTAGISDGQYDPLTDRGDGILALVHPVDDMPKTLLLNPLVPTLVTLLAERNARLTGAERCRRELRLRAVIHAGEIHSTAKAILARRWTSLSGCSMLPGLRAAYARRKRRWSWSSPKTSTGPSCGTNTRASREAPSRHSSGSRSRADVGAAGCTSPFPSRPRASRGVPAEFHHRRLMPSARSRIVTEPEGPRSGGYPRSPCRSHS